MSRCVFVIWAAVLSLTALTAPSAMAQGADAHVPRDLVVMINGRTPSGSEVLGAGLIVGQDTTGRTYIATARHVVTDLFGPYEITVSHFTAPGQPVPAELVKSDFNEYLDLAVIAADLPAAGPDAPLPVGSLVETPEIGDDVKLIGQTEGEPWAETPTTEKVGISIPGRIVVISEYGGPGLSGGAAFDTSGRIIGIAVTDDRSIITILPLSVIAEELARYGIPFMIEEGEKIVDLLDDATIRERLKVALTSGLIGDLSAFEPNQKIALLMEEILVNDTSVRSLFFSRFNRHESLDWLRSQIEAGLNPNFIAQVEDGRSALYYALWSNNVELAIVLLEEGASPHAFQELWGNESRSVSLLNPLEWLPIISASEGEKRRLVRAMAEAGMAVVVRSPGGQYAFDESEAEKNVKVLQHVGIEPASVDALIRENRRCEWYSARSEINWCAEIEKVPTLIEDITDAGDDLDEGFIIGKFLGIYDGRMYFFAIAANEWAGYPYSIAVISRGRDTVEIYRHTRNGAGLGHCSRLRDQALGRVVGDYTEADRNASCWRRTHLSRTFGQAGYDWWWEQSYYCRDGSVENRTIEPVRSGSAAWSSIPEAARMRGRVPC